MSSEGIETEEDVRSSLLSKFEGWKTEEQMEETVNLRELQDTIETIKQVIYSWKSHADCGTVKIVICH